MIKFLLQKGFASFGRKYKYDTAYLEEASKIYPAKAWRYALLSPYVQHRTAASKEAYFAAKITAAHITDCSPCTNLTIEMAIEAGIEHAQLKAIIMGNKNAMTPDILLGYNYAHALIENSSALAGYIRDITIQFGKRGLWDLSSAVALGEFFPKLKRGLGEAKSCLAPQDLARGIGNEQT